MSGDRLPRWGPADFGRAMVAYVEHHAQHARRRADGIASEAFYRGGDNPESLRVWEESGTWADPRDPSPPAKHGARDFAAHIAGMTLPELMERWGSTAVSPAPRTRSPSRDSTVTADARRMWG